LLAFREFSRCTLVLPALIGVIGAPIAIYLDVDLADSLRKVLVNEPNYYLAQ
jgi:hypothetical protein